MRRGVIPHSASIEGVDGHHLAAAGKQRRRAPCAGWRCRSDRRCLRVDQFQGARVSAPAVTRRYDARRERRAIRRAMSCDSACDRRAMSHLSPSTACSPSQQLMTGWEREVAVGDTLLRRFLFHHAALDAAFTLAGGGRSPWTPMTCRWPIWAVRVATSTARCCCARRPTGTSSLGRIERFVGGGLGQVCLWSAWPTPDLHRRGWRLSGHPPLLVRPPLSTIPVGETSTPHLEFRRRDFAVGPGRHGNERRSTAIPWRDCEDAPVGSFASPDPAR